MMYIRGITIGIEHLHDSDEEVRNLDACQVRFPDSWEEYGRQLNKALVDNGGVHLSIGSTSTPGRTVIAIGHLEVVDSPNAVQENRNALCFVVDLATLQQLRGALDAAIATGE